MSELADDLRMIYDKHDRLRRQVQESKVWRAIEQHIRTQGERNCLVDFPWWAKLYSDSAGHGISLRKISPYGLTAGLQHAEAFRAEINVGFVEKEDEERERDKDYEIQIPYDLVENFSHTKFAQWIDEMREKMLEREIKAMKALFEEKFTKHPDLRDWVDRYISPEVA